MQVARAQVHIVPANEYRRVRWRNGLGWTREIVRAPDDGAFDWRLSIAEIERDAAFSAFPGVDRELVLLTGALRLRFGDGGVHEILPPYARLRFPGEEAVHAEPVEGPAVAFNLMWRRGAVDASVWRRPLVGAMIVFVDPRETWALHLLSGHARFADGSDAPMLEAGDTVLMHGGEGRRRSALDGAGEALLIRLAPAGRNSDVAPSAAGG